MANWNYIHISSEEEMRMSGWKLYVFGKDMEDSRLVGSKLLGLCAEYDITVKIATQGIISRNIGRNIAWGVAVIYLHAELFEGQLVSSFICEAKRQLSGYNSLGHIVGAKSIDDKLHYRWDVKCPVDPCKGLDYEAYLSLYRGEYGEYNIRGNRDLTDYQTLI